MSRVKDLVIELRAKIGCINFSKQGISFDLNMKEVTNNFERIMPYDGLQPLSWVYYHVSKRAKEEPNKTFHLNLCEKKHRK